MDRLLIAAGLCVVVVAVALVLRRRRADAPTQPSWTVPAQLDRADFGAVTEPWLVVVFSSRTCDTCAAVVQAAEALASPEVRVVDAEVERDRALHDRYAIDAVPTVVVAGPDGVVRASHVGPVSASDLWGTMAELRGT